MGRYLNMEDLVIDKEFEELLPVLTMEESERLEQGILQNGLLDPIKVWEEPGTGRYIIIDGHNRYRILKKNGMTLNSWNYKIIYASELKNREEVKRWMLEQQLGRRNLSETEKYEIVQKFKSVFEKRAKQNQSLGGKGLTNLTKVDTRKEMAKATGVSVGTYRKIDAVMKSGNEDLKQRLRKKQVSVDAAHKELQNTEHKTITPKQQIEQLDKRINDIDSTVKSLLNEKDKLTARRSSIFYALDIKCPVKYRWLKKTVFQRLWQCQIYIENEGNENVFGNYSVYSDEFPSEYNLGEVPEKYRNDFRMVWKAAHDELKALADEEDKKSMEDAKRLDELLQNATMLIPKDEDKPILKKFYRVLANTYHPDNKETEDTNMMKYVNNLKVLWGLS